MSMKNITDGFSNLGSTARSSEGIYSDKARTLFSPVKSSENRLLSVPESFKDAVASPASTESASTDTGGSAWRYLFIFLILIFLSVNLVLFLIKPVSTPISQMYDPLFDFSNRHFKTNFNVDGGLSKKGPITASVSKKNNTAAVKKLEKVIDAKPIINNIDKEDASLLPPKPIKKYKKLPVIPEADDSTSRVQMNPTSKSGFCYIGEDRGFRSCIEVGEGDVCMSGNIFPTEAICINPNLRE